MATVALLESRWRAAAYAQFALTLVNGNLTLNEAGWWQRIQRAKRANTEGKLAVEFVTRISPERVVVAPSVSLNTKSSFGGKTFVLCLFSWKRHSFNVSSTCLSQTKLWFCNTPRAY